MKPKMKKEPARNGTAWNNAAENFRSQALLLLFFMAAFLAGCSSSGGQDISPEVRELAREAYIFAYPMLENYRAIYYMAIEPNNGEQNRFNQLVHNTELHGPESTFIISPNNDTINSWAILDLRAEPVVITVPAITERYYSVQLIDMYTHNMGYIGTRATGTEAGNFLIAPPGWTGTVPESCRRLFQSEGNFVVALIRTGCSGTDDLPNILSIQQQYAVTPLSTYLGETSPPAPAMDIFPAYDKEDASSAAFITYFNFLLGQLEIHSSETELFDRLAELGIGPNAPARGDADMFSINAGIDDALEDIEAYGVQLGYIENGWQLNDKILGNRQVMQGRYLVRAAAARYGLWGNDMEEAYYPSVRLTADGQPLDAYSNRYMLHFDAAELPPVDGFWSITMYNPQGFMIENPIDRYAIGDRTEGLVYGIDGSLTLYIQSTDPGGDLSSNWLPAPSGPFRMTLRMYLPVPDALDPLYAPPPIQSR